MMATNLLINGWICLKEKGKQEYNFMLCCSTAITVFAVVGIG